MYGSSLDVIPLAHWVNERHAIYLRNCALEGKVPPPQFAPVFPLIEDKTWTLNCLWPMARGRKVYCEICLEGHTEEKPHGD
jgi:hypothetical protein